MALEGNVRVWFMLMDGTDHGTLNKHGPFLPEKVFPTFPQPIPQPLSLTLKNPAELRRDLSTPLTLFHALWPLEQGRNKALLAHTAYINVDLETERPMDIETALVFELEG
eukprot:14179896-Alexandrium_andersonii.AAC.1